MTYCIRVVTAQSRVPRSRPNNGSCGHGNVLMPRSRYLTTRRLCRAGRAVWAGGAVWTGRATGSRRLEGSTPCGRSVPSCTDPCRMVQLGLSVLWPLWTVYGPVSAVVYGPVPDGPVGLKCAMAIMDRVWTGRCRRVWTRVPEGPVGSSALWTGGMVLRRRNEGSASLSGRPPEASVASTVGLTVGWALDRWVTLRRLSP